MIGPHDSFEGLVRLGIERYLSPPNVAPAQAALDREVVAAMKAHGLVSSRHQFLGGYLQLPGCQPLGRSRLYSLVEPDQVFAMVRKHVEVIAQHGPGVVWFTSDPVHYIHDDGAICMATVNDDPKRYVLLRTFYAHEAQARPL